MFPQFKQEIKGCNEIGNSLEIIECDTLLCFSIMVTSFTPVSNVVSMRLKLFVLRNVPKKKKICNNQY